MEKMQRNATGALIRMSSILESSVVPLWKQNQKPVCWRRDSFPVGSFWRRSNNFRVVRNSLLKTFNYGGIWIPVNLKVSGSASLLKQLVNIEPSSSPSSLCHETKEGTTTKKRDDGNLFLIKGSLLRDWLTGVIICQIVSMCRNNHISFPQPEFIMVLTKLVIISRGFLCYLVVSQCLGRELILEVSFKIPVLCNAQYLTKICRNSVAILGQTTGYFHADFDGVQLQMNKWRAKSLKYS